MTKNLYLLFFTSIILTCNFCLGQQLPMYTNYTLNNYAYNPAVAGSKPYAVASINYRNQWTGFEDAPKTYLLSLQGPVGRQKKAALGGLISSDNTGLLSRTSGYMTFAYHVKLNETYKLGMGLSLGMAQYRIKLYDARVADTGDDLLTGNLISNNVFDSNGGLYLYSDKLFFGISGYQYLGNKITFKNSKSRLTPHIYSTLGYTFILSKDYSLQPAALIKFSAPTPVQPEFTLRGFYKNLLWVGSSYRLKESLSILVGVILKEKLTIGYAYDIQTAGMRNYNSGSHEMSLTYQFIKPKRKLNADEEELNDIDNSVKSRLKKQNEEGTK